MSTNYRKELYNSENQPDKKGWARNIVSISTKAAISKLAFDASSYVPTGVKRESLRYLKGFHIGGEEWFNSPGYVKNTSSASAQEVVWNTIKGAEETLFRIPRAFNLSSIYGSRVYRKSTINFAGGSKELESQAEYLLRVSKGKITSAHIAEGIHFSQGKIYSKSGDVLLNRASIMPGRWEAGEYSFTSKLAKALYQQHHLHIPTEAETIITGGDTIWSASTEKLSAWSLLTVKNYLKLLDDPFELALKAVQATGNKDGNIGKAASWLNDSFISRMYPKNQFGVGGWAAGESGSVSELIGMHMKRGLPKLLAAGAAIYASDQVLKSTLGYGYRGLAAKAYRGVTRTYAKVSDVTGLTKYRKWQEGKAKGSTSKMAIASFPIAGAIAGGTVGKISEIISQTNIAEKAAPPQWFRSAISDLESSNGWKGKLGSVSEFLNLSETGRVGAFAAIGASAGLAAVAMFAPGALGSKRSSDELDDIYSGKKLLPVRRGRFWEFGKQPYEGDEIKYHLPHWTNRVLSDARDKSIYPEKYYKHPLKRFIARLTDPYYLERALDEERPYKYWSAPDHGGGLFEKVMDPIRKIFKPTILAHPEASNRTSGKPFDVPEGAEAKDYITTSGYHKEIKRPDSLSEYLHNVVNSTEHMGGLQSFGIKSLLNKMAGEHNLQDDSEIWESSGRILSSQRRYWDEGFGGFGTLSEVERRLNTKRLYSRQYVSSDIRNKMPDWMVERLKYGDPFSRVESGELRLPGRGFAALHPELKDVDPNDYPSVYKMSILGDIAPGSFEYYAQKAEAQKAIDEGRVNQAGIDVYENTLSRINEKYKGDEYDNPDSIIGKYWLGLKKVGRDLPTESLYPFSPIHKFAGRVDVATEYQSNRVLDKEFKSWANPIKDYVKPTFNKMINSLSLVHYTPKDTQERNRLDDYFDELQYKKNAILKDKANSALNDGNFKLSMFYKRGVRKTFVGSSYSTDTEELKSLLPDKDKRYFDSMLNAPQNQRSKILDIASPRMAKLLSAKWNNRNQGRFLPDEEMQNNMPDRDFTGYAPGVDLNALKVKVARNTARNIREFSLWKHDERKAAIYDASIRALSNGNNVTGIGNEIVGSASRKIKDYARAAHMPGANISISPTVHGGSVSLNLNPNNRDEIKDKMKELGWVSY